MSNNKPRKKKQLKQEAVTNEPAAKAPQNAAGDQGKLFVPVAVLSEYREITEQPTTNIDNPSDLQAAEVPGAETSVVAATSTEALSPAGRDSAITLNVYLRFQPPEPRPGPAGTPIRPSHLRRLREEINEYLDDATSWVERLQKDGWQTALGINSIVCQHPAHSRKSEALKRLRSLGIPRQTVLRVERIYEDPWAAQWDGNRVELQGKSLWFRTDEPSWNTALELATLRGWNPEELLVDEGLEDCEDEEDEDGCGIAAADWDDDEEEEDDFEDEEEDGEGDPSSDCDEAMSTVGLFISAERAARLADALKAALPDIPDHDSRNCKPAARPIAARIGRHFGVEARNIPEQRFRLNAFEWFSGRRKKVLRKLITFLRKGEFSIESWE